MRLFLHFMVNFLFLVALSGSSVWASEMIDKVIHVTKTLGCEFPYLLVQIQNSDRFFAEAKISDPEKIRRYGFEQANTGDLVAIEENETGQYLVSVAADRFGLDKSQEKPITIDLKPDPQPEEFTRQNTAGDSDQYVTIKGVVENWAIAWPYLRDDTYLQLVEIVPGQGIKRLVSDGRVHLFSDLPRTSVSANGSFEFRMNELEKGKYILFLQNFELALGSAQRLRGTLTKNGEPFQLVVNERTRVASFNCGKLTIHGRE